MKLRMIKLRIGTIEDDLRPAWLPEECVLTGGMLTSGQVTVDSMVRFNKREIM